MIDRRFSDSQLVALYQTGNEEAFEMLLHRHKSRIYTAIYMIVKDRYQAEDLLQDTFIKAINTIKSGRYNEEGKFLPGFVGLPIIWPSITLEEASAIPRWFWRMVAGYSTLFSFRKTRLKPNSSFEIQNRDCATLLKNCPMSKNKF
jgi:hypothetical protein